MMKKTFFFRSVAALFAVMVMLALPGCSMGSNDPPPELQNDPINGVMNLSTAEKVFGKRGVGFEEYDKEVKILEFNNVAALGEYLSGAGRQVQAAVQATFKINSINGKPVTSIKPGAFKPKAALEGADDISQLARFLNPAAAPAELPDVVIVLPDTLELDIDDLGGGLFEGVSGAIKVEIPTPVIEKILEKEIDKQVAGLSEAEAEARKQEIKEALAEAPQGELVRELTEKLTETIQAAVGKGAGEAAAITIEKVAPSSPAPANPEAPVVVVPELPPIVVEPTPVETPPAVTPPVTTTPPPSGSGSPGTPSTPSTPPDLTAPVLSPGSAVQESFGGTTAGISFSTDEAGTYYYVVLGADAAEPTAAEIRAASSGIHGTGSAGTGTTAISVTGLTVSTAYKAYLVVRDAGGNTSAILEIAFTPVYSPAGQLAVDLGGTGITGEGATVTLAGNKTISTTVTVPAGVTLDTELYTLTIDTSGVFTVNGILSVKGTFNMAGKLSVGADGVIDVESDGVIIFAQDRTGGGDFEGTINIKNGGVSKDLKGGESKDLWNTETGKSVFHAGAKGYSSGETDAHLLIGTDITSTTTVVALTSGTFTSTKSGYRLDGNATMNRNFGLNNQFTIKDGKLTVHIKAQDTPEADGLWLVGEEARIVGEGTAVIEVVTPTDPGKLGYIFLSGDHPPTTHNFYNAESVLIETPNPHIEIGVGVYDWTANLGGSGGWKKQGD